MNYLHAQSPCIVHRDLTSSNILVSLFCKPKLESLCTLHIFLIFAFYCVCLTHPSQVDEIWQVKVGDYGLSGLERKRRKDQGSLQTLSTSINPRAAGIPPSELSECSNPLMSSAPSLQTSPSITHENKALPFGGAMPSISATGEACCTGANACTGGGPVRSPHGEIDNGDFTVLYRDQSSMTVGDEYEDPWRNLSGGYPSRLMCESSGESLEADGEEIQSSLINGRVQWRAPEVSFALPIVRYEFGIQLLTLAIAKKHDDNAFDQGSVTPKSDVYSYGIILWELVSRKRPFGDLPPQEVCCDFTDRSTDYYSNVNNLSILYTVPGASTGCTRRP